MKFSIGIIAVALVFFLCPEPINSNGKHGGGHHAKKNNRNSNESAMKSKEKNLDLNSEEFKKKSSHSRSSNSEEFEKKSSHSRSSNSEEFKKKNSHSRGANSEEFKKKNSHSKGTNSEEFKKKNSHSKTRKHHRSRSEHNKPRSIFEIPEGQTAAQTFDKFLKTHQCEPSTTVYHMFMIHHKVASSKPGFTPEQRGDNYLWLKELAKKVDIDGTERNCPVPKCRFEGRSFSRSLGPPTDSTNYSSPSKVQQNPSKISTTISTIRPIIVTQAPIVQTQPKASQINETETTQPEATRLNATTPNPMMTFFPSMNYPQPNVTFPMNSASFQEEPQTITTTKPRFGIDTSYAFF